MSHDQQQLMEYACDLYKLVHQLNSDTEPKAAYLLTDSAHGEAIIEASLNLRKAILDMLADVSVTISI